METTRAKGTKFELHCEALFASLDRPVVLSVGERNQKKFGDTHCGMEMKFQGRIHDYSEGPSLYLEIWERNEYDKKLYPAGMSSRTPWVTLVTGDDEVVFLFERQALTEVFTEKQHKRLWPSHPVQNDEGVVTSYGILMPLCEAYLLKQEHFHTKGWLV